MRWRFRSRSFAVGDIFVMASFAAAALVEPAKAQAPLFNDFNAFDQQWTLARPFAAWGLNADFGAVGINRQAYTTPFGSGTVGLFVESNTAGAGGAYANLLGPLPAFPTSQGQDWFAGLGSPQWRTSVFGGYKSDPALFNGLYTTASFGVTDFRSNALGFSGLPNLPGDAVAVTARAGVGLQITPQITIEGSVGFTQLQTSPFR